MSDFYREWSERRNSGEDDSLYITMFLRNEEQAVTSLLNGSEPEQETAFTVIKGVPIESFIGTLQDEPMPRTLVSGDIPCFSKLEDGASRLNELLQFEPNQLTFEEAGYQLRNSVSKRARTKYGECHAKLAAMMSLVTITKSSSFIVRPTPWGSYLIRYDWKEKESVLRKMLLRDICVKTMVKSALAGPARYRTLVSCLSDSTAGRRKSNVKCLINFVLSGTEYEDILIKIDWTV